MLRESRATCSAQFSKQLPCSWGCANAMEIFFWGGGGGGAQQARTKANPGARLEQQGINFQFFVHHKVWDIKCHSQERDGFYPWRSWKCRFQWPYTVTSSKFFALFKTGFKYQAGSDWWAVSCPSSTIFIPAGARFRRPNRCNAFVVHGSRGRGDFSVNNEWRDSSALPSCHHSSFDDLLEIWVSVQDCFAYAGCMEWDCAIQWQERTSGKHWEFHSPRVLSHFFSDFNRKTKDSSDVIKSASFVRVFPSEDYSSNKNLPRTNDKSWKPSILCYIIILLYASLAVIAAHLIKTWRAHSMTDFVWLHDLDVSCGGTKWRLPLKYFVLNILNYVSKSSLEYMEFLFVTDILLDFSLFALFFKFFQMWHSAWLSFWLVCLRATCPIRSKRSSFWTLWYCFASTCLFHLTASHSY